MHVRGRRARSACWLARSAAGLASPSALPTHQTQTPPTWAPPASLNAKEIVVMGPQNKTDQEVRGSPRGGPAQHAVKASSGRRCARCGQRLLVGCSACPPSTLLHLAQVLEHTALYGVPHDPTGTFVGTKVGGWVGALGPCASSCGCASAGRWVGLPSHGWAPLCLRRTTPASAETSRCLSRSSSACSACLMWVGRGRRAGRGRGAQSEQQLQRLLDALTPAEPAGPAGASGQRGSLACEAANLKASLHPPRPLPPCCSTCGRPARPASLPTA